MKGKIAIVGGGRHSLLTAVQINEAYQQGRADAIEEFVDAITCTSCFTNMQKDAIRMFAEQLKEQKK